MTIQDIMSRDVVTVSPGTALMEIRKLLHERGFHHLLVVEGDELRGVISDRDVLRALSPFLDTRSETARDVRTLTKNARDMMRDDPITVAPDTSIEDAAQVLLDRSISSLPVVDGGKLLGIVTTKDLLEHYAAKEHRAG
jgi:acetoin utilization protein AcuB